MKRREFIQASCHHGRCIGFDQPTDRCRKAALQSDSAPRFGQDRRKAFHDWFWRNRGDE